MRRAVPPYAPRRAGRTARRLGALVWALLVAVGALEIHPAGEALHVGGWPGAETEAVFDCAPGHDRGQLHVEPAVAVPHQHCPGCLHRQQTAGADRAEGAGLAVPAAPDRLAAPSEPGLAVRAPRSTRSRGPPLS